MFQQMYDDASRSAQKEAAPEKREKLVPTEELTPEEMKRRAAAAIKEGVPGKGEAGPKEMEFETELELGGTEEQPIELNDWRVEEQKKKEFAKKVADERAKMAERLKGKKSA